MSSDSRQRLRPWLIGQLDDRKIPGLEWLPNEKGLIDRTKFRIPWKHGGKHDWTPDKGKVFKEWAVHTGKYREGVDDETFARWKTNLRCALNKASDIQEVVEESQREADEPFKVYKFLPRKDKNASHPIHKNYYTDNSIYKQMQQNNQDRSHTIPAQVADYIAPGSSINDQRPSSHPHMNVGMPSDLQNLTCDSMERDYLSSYDRDRLLRETIMKEESMDFEDDSSRPFDDQTEGMVPRELGYNLNPVIKKEIIDHPQCTSPLQDNLYIDQGRRFQDQLLERAGESRHSHIQSPDLVCPSPLNPMTPVNAEQSRFSSPSPAHFNTPSSPRQHHCIRQENAAHWNFSTAASPYAYAPVPSPAGLVAGSSSAPLSPLHDFAQSPVPSPQVNNDYGSSVASQMAKLDMREPISPPVQPGMLNNDFRFGVNRVYEKIDIGHPCNEADDSAMMITIYYQSKKIIEHHVTEPAGCIIAYDPLTDQQIKILDDVGLSMVKEALYATKNGRVKIPLPDWQRTDNAKLDREVVNLLKNTGRGITIECKNGDIYAKRLCKTSVYYATHFNNEKCQKIERHEDVYAQVKVFDYRGTFLPAAGYFEQEARNNPKAEPKHPIPDVYLFVGQKGTPSHADARFVVIKVTSCKASKVIKTIEKDLFSITPVISISTSLDELDRNIRQEIGIIEPTDNEK